MPNQLDKPRVTRLLFDTAEAAEMLGISIKTLRGIVSNGEIEYVLIGRLIKFTQRQIDAFIDARATNGARIPRGITMNVSIRKKRCKVAPPTEQTAVASDSETRHQQIKRHFGRFKKTFP